MLATPAVPAISSTVASCSAAGSTNISNYLASNSYTFAPTGPTVGAGVGIRNDDRPLIWLLQEMEVVLLVHLHHFNAAMLATPAVPAISSTVAVPLQDQQMHITLRLTVILLHQRVPTVEQGISIRNDDRYLLYGYFRKWKLYLVHLHHLAMQQCWHPSAQLLVK
jgi:hypothetical protein